MWAAMAVRVCVYPYVVHGVNLRIECEKGDVAPPQDFKSLHFLIAGGGGITPPQGFKSLRFIVAGSEGWA